MNLRIIILFQLLFFCATPISAQKKIKLIKQESTDQKGYKTVYYTQKKNPEVKHGAFLKYYKNILVEKAYYEDNLLNGLFEKYNQEYGQLQLTESYKNGIKHGPCSSFSRGKKYTDTYYNNGNFDSIYFYFESGEVLSKFIRKDNSDHYVSYFQNGNLNEERFHNKTTGESSYKLFFSNGNPHRHFILKNDFPYEDVFCKDINGEAIDGGKLEKGSGNFIFYKLFSLRLEKSFEFELLNAKPNGLLKVFYEDVLFVSGGCSEGSKNGVWNTYDSNGMLTDVKDYDEIIKEEIVFSYSQDGGMDEIFSITELMPVFNGGEQEMYKFLGGNTRYSSEAKEQDLQGTVFVSFIVNPEGKIKNVRILRNVHPILDEEVIRVIKSMPDWVPGFQKGVPVNVRYNLPVKFLMK